MFWYLKICLLNNQLKKKQLTLGTSLVVQWLRLHAPNAGGLGSIPGQGTGSHMPQLKDPEYHNKDTVCPK